MHAEAGRRMCIGDYILEKHFYNSLSKRNLQSNYPEYRLWKLFRYILAVRRGADWNCRMGDFVV